MSFTNTSKLENDQFITNNGFYPNVLISHFITTYRIPSQYAIESTTEGLIQSIISINQVLIDIQATIISLGYNSLMDYALDNSDKIAGEEILISLYKKAVFSHAKAFLIKMFETMNPIKEDKAGSVDSIETYKTWLNESSTAIYLFKNKVNNIVEISTLSNTYVGLI